MPNNPRARTFSSLRELSSQVLDLRSLIENEANTLDVWLQLRSIARQAEETADLLMYQKTLDPSSTVPSSGRPFVELLPEDD